MRYSCQRATRPDVARPPMLLVHGFGAALEHWRQNIPDLSQEHTVYAIDLLGFGASRKPPTRYTLALWAEQIYAFWKTFVRRPAVLVGNSLGSAVSAIAAATYPDMAAGVILLNLPDASLRAAALPKGVEPVVRAFESAIASPPLLKGLFAIFKQRAAIRWVLSRLAYTRSSAVSPELVELIVAPTRDRDAPDAFCALSTSALEPDFSPAIAPLLAQLPIPILLVWGRQDRMVPFQLSQFYLDLNPRLQFVPLDNVGHCPHDEVPEPLNRLLLAWLDTHWPAN